MYCPKCKQNFEEGSRRFCPTDGARLIADAADKREAPSGVFANLISKLDTVSEFDETLSDVPHFDVTESQPRISGPAQPVDDDIFFELGEIEPDAVPQNVFIRPSDPAPTSSRSDIRKVNQNMIPAGHVDLADPDRPPLFGVDFNEREPESFVGRIVKGRYKVTEFLGGDESGLAYLADDKIMDDKKVLVRVLLAAPSDEIIGSILAEERVSLSHFSHPNIARLIDSGQFANGKNFLISEYVDALSVGDILSIHGQFDEQRTARVIRQAAQALSEAHQEGILHRDLRPENLILDTSAGDSEQTKLVNFGASDGEPTPLNSAYKSPEVLDGRIATISSDVFSLAVVAYEMLTGKVPFEGSSAKEIIRAQNAGFATLPTEIRPELSSAVDEVLDKAMSYRAAGRYPKARDFGDAFFTALTDVPQVVAVSGEHVTVATPTPTPTPTSTPTPAPVAAMPSVPGNAGVKIVQLAPIATTAAKVPSEPAWKNRSPEPPTVESSRAKLLAAVGILALLIVIGLGWYYLVNRTETPDVPAQADQTGGPQNTNVSRTVSNTEMPPLARTIPQPPNTNFYQNSKQNLRGDLLHNFVAFTMFYPKDWKVIGPRQSTTPNTRGKFIDISRTTPDDRMQEQMLVGYYPSKGTFNEDVDKFPQLVKETNETLKKILPGYQMVSQGEIRLNGDWRAYEIKFQAGGTSGSGEKLVVWGRRLFIPAARPGVRNGFEITMLVTSFADEVHSVDDVGVKGGLAGILYSFEPSQNF